MQSENLVTKAVSGYELLDSGNEEKLERYGDYVLARPDPQALWEKKLPAPEWHKADAWYERNGKTGKWHMRKDMPKEWTIPFGPFNFLIKPSTFKHTGLFPEQDSNWKWTHELIQKAGRPVSVLNLFAYTGAATLAAAKAGANVVHLDASKTAVEWARKNAELSGLLGKPIGWMKQDLRPVSSGAQRANADAPLRGAGIRWVTEDALSFVKREVKRGNKYDAIIMDPPAFGHGPKDELWKIEESFLGLMDNCKKLLSEKPLFFLVNGYAAGYSHLAFRYNLDSVQKQFGGTLQSGELGIEEKSGRILPSGIYARWSKQ